MDKNLQTDILRLLALLLCVTFLLGAVVGDAAGIAVGAPAGPGENLFPGDSLLGIDAAAAMETYPPDKVMLSAGDLAVTWGLFYYILYNTGAQLTYGFQDPLDWQEISPHGNTWGELVKDYVIDQCTQILVFLYGAEEGGVYFSEEDFEEFQAMIDEMIAGAESVESLESELRDAGFYSIAVYEELLRTFAIQEKLPVSLYGENFDEISDDAVAEFAEREGFMRAKHILRLFPPEGSDETKEDVYAEMEDILAQIEYRNSSGEPLYPLFDEFVEEYSEDPGSFSYPEGYLFQHYDMVPEFSDACEKLQIGQMSGIVETEYGFHIILRLALDYDNGVPLSLANQGQYYTLRQLAVFDDFDNLYLLWLDSLDIVYSPELEALDIATIFAWR